MCSKNIFITLYDESNNKIVINEENHYNFKLYYQLKIEKYTYNSSLNNNYKIFYKYKNCQLNIHLLYILYYMQKQISDNQKMKINDLSLNIFFEDYCKDILEEFLTHNMSQYKLNNNYYLHNKYIGKIYKEIYNWTICKI